MKYLIPILCATLLTGCGTIDLKTPLENRIACSINKDEAYTVSKWAFFGFAFKVSDKDTTLICPSSYSLPSSLIK